jgi:alkenylglycerophosphocholine hydrolase
VAAVWILLAVAGVAALLDWWAVGTGRTSLEYAAKPAVLAALTAAAALIPDDHTDLSSRRWWFVAALACCLLGDVLLMLPRDLFVPGLAAFLAGHVLFIVGLLQPASPPSDPPFSFSTTGIVVALGVVVVAEAVPSTLILRALLRQGQGGLMGPVCLYMAAIVTMAVLATNVGVLAAAVGAAAFLVSDTLLALNRFVRPIPKGSLWVHITYHLAQGLLVVSLLK